LEGPVGGINGDSDWTVLLAFGGKIFFRAGFDFSVASKTDADTLGFIEFALLFVGNIRIVFLGHEFTFLVILDIGEGIGHETTIAAIAGGNAIDKVLFREGMKFALLVSEDTFSGLDSGEGPAGTALSLILDLVDAAFVTPVDAFGIGNGWDAFSSVKDLLESEHGFVFSWGHSSEFVHGNSEG